MDYRSFFRYLKSNTGISRIFSIPSDLPPSNREIAIILFPLIAFSISSVLHFLDPKLLLIKNLASNLVFETCTIFSFLKICSLNSIYFINDRVYLMIIAHYALIFSVLFLIIHRFILARKPPRLESFKRNTFIGHIFSAVFIFLFIWGIPFYSPGINKSYVAQCGLMFFVVLVPLIARYELLCFQIAFLNRTSEESIAEKDNEDDL